MIGGERERERIEEEEVCDVVSGMSAQNFGGRWTCFLAPRHAARSRTFFPTCTWTLEHSNELRSR